MTFGTLCVFRSVQKPVVAMRCLDLQKRKMGSMQRILEFQGSVSKSRQLFPRSLQSFGDDSIRALQYMPHDPRDFIMVLVAFRSQVGAAQLLWFLSTQISSCGRSPGSGQGKGQHWWGCWAEPRSESSVTRSVSAAPRSPSWLCGLAARLSVCGCPVGSLAPLTQVKLCFISGQMVGTPRTCLPGLAVEMEV